MFLSNSVPMPATQSPNLRGTWLALVDTASFQNGSPIFALPLAAYGCSIAHETGLPLRLQVFCIRVILVGVY